MVGGTTGAAVGITVVVGSGNEVGFAVASDSGVSGGNAGVAAAPLGVGTSVGLGAGVAVVQAITAIRRIRSTRATGRKGFSMEGVHPSVRSR